MAKAQLHRNAKKGEQQMKDKSEGPMGGSHTGGSRIGKAFTKKEAFDGVKESGCMKW